MRRVMVLGWLCAARAAAEWVQISQQHYQKPVRLTTIDNPAVDSTRDAFNENAAGKPTRTLHRDATTDTYLNHSIPEHDWNQKFRQPIRRGDATATTNGYNNWNEPHRSKQQNDVGITNKPYEINKYEVKDTVSNSETVSGKVERVPNIGSVKRVQLANTPVKSQALKISQIPDRNADRRSDAHRGDGTQNNDGDIDIKTDIFKDVFKKPSNSFKHIFSIAEEDLSHVGHINTTVTKVNTKAPASNIEIHPFAPMQNLDMDIVALVGKGHSNKQNGVPEIMDVPAGNKELNKNINRPVQTQGERTNDKEDVTVFISKKENEEKAIHQNKFIETTKGVVKPDNYVPNKDNINAKIESVKFKKHTEDESQLNSENGEINSSSSEIKVNTMENILKFMKVVAETISKNTRRGANGKITYLNELKHTLLANIKERIDAAWPDDTSPSSGRRSRSAQAQAQSRGHVEFPSSESALMTISFLTFAVFLIKLVLQVIQTYKHKTMLMAPLMVATAGRAISKKLRAST